MGLMCSCRRAWAGGGGAESGVYVRGCVTVCVLGGGTQPAIQGESPLCQLSGVRSDNCVDFFFSYPSGAQVPVALGL